MMTPAKAAGLIDPVQQAIGLRPTQVRPVDHAVDTGPPFFPGVTPSPPVQVTEVAVLTPTLTVVQVSEGIAIFGTGGGRAVIP